MCVLGRDKVYSDRAFGCFGVSNGFRYFCVRLVDNLWFERVILLLIVVNCTIIALEEEMSENTFEILEVIFSSLFTLEMMAKLLASGVAMHETAYFRSGWNWLDFLVVVAGWLTLVPGVKNFQVIRALRILRAVRTIRRIKGLRILIESLLFGVGALGRLLLVVVFILLIFVAFGLHLWGGLLRQRCVGAAVVDAAVTCSRNSDYGQQCPSGTSCLITDTNPDRDFTSFDHFGWGMLTVLRVFSLDGWANVMFYVQDAWSGWAVVIFMLLAGFAVLFVVNFVLAILFDTYTEMSVVIDEQEAQLERAMARRNAARKEAQRERKARAAEATRDARTQYSSGRYSGGYSGYSASSHSSAAYSEMQEESDYEDLVVKTWYPTRPSDRPVCWENPFAWLRLRLIPYFSFLNDSSHQLREDYLDSKCDCCRCFRNFTDSFLFKTVVGVLIVANIVLFAVEYNTMSSDTEDILDIANFVFIGLFALEMVLKLFSMGVKGYLHDRFNWLDGFIVIVSFFEVFLVSTSAVTAFRALRIVRVMRLFHSAKWLYYVRVTVNCLMRSLKSVFYLVLLTMLFVFIFALVGRQLFKDKMTFSEVDAPRANFDDLFKSALTVFIIMTGKGYADVMYNTMVEEEWWGAIFCTIVFGFGNYVLVNLFICILMSNWDPASGDHFDDDSYYSYQSAANSQSSSRGSIKDRSDYSLSASGYSEQEEESDYYSESSVESAYGYSDASSYGSCAACSCCGELGLTEDNVSVPIHLRRRKPPGLSQDCLSRAVRSFWFEVVADILALTSAIVLCFDSPVMRNSWTEAGTFFDAMDYLFTGLLAVELLLRFIAYRGYFAWDGWCWFDCVVLVASIIGLPYSGSYKGVFMRAFRVLRVLRILLRLRVMRIMLRSFYELFFRLLGPVLIFAVSYLIFTLVGMQLFLGKFGSCNDPLIESKDACVGTFNSGLVDREWTVASTNFDDFGHALLAMFEVITLVDWSTHMYNGMDGTNRNEVSSLNHNEAVGLFFVAFVIIQVWVVLPLFVVVAVDTFVDVARTLKGSVFATNVVRQRRMTAFVMDLATPPEEQFDPPPEESCRSGLFYFVQHNAFEVFISICIGINTVYLLMRHYNESDDWGSFLDISNYVFVGIYLVEAVLKIIALNPKQYFTDPWSVFDFAVLLISIVGIVVEVSAGTSTALSVFRAIRILRTMRLVNRTGRFQALFYAIMHSVWPVLNVAAVCAVVMSFYSVISVAWFADLDMVVDLDDNRTLRHYGAAMMMMYRLLTGEVWSELTDKVRVRSKFAPVLFISFWMLCKFLLLNVFVVIAFEAYGQGYRFVKVRMLGGGKKISLLLTINAQMHRFRNVLKTLRRKVSASKLPISASCSLTTSCSGFSLRLMTRTTSRCLLCSQF